MLAWSLVLTWMLPFGLQGESSLQGRFDVLRARMAPIRREFERHYGADAFATFTGDSVPRPYLLAVERRSYQDPAVVARDYGAALAFVRQHLRNRLGPELPWSRVHDEHKPLLVVILDDPELGERVVALPAGRAARKSAPLPDRAFVPIAGRAGDPFSMLGYQAAGQLLDGMNCGFQPLAPWLRAGICESVAALRRMPSHTLEPGFIMGTSRGDLVLCVRRAVLRKRSMLARDLVRMVPGGQASARPSADVAAFSWALVRFLETRHRHAFLALLDDALRHKLDERTFARHLKLRGRDDWSRFEDEFHRYLREDLVLGG